MIMHNRLLERRYREVRMSNHNTDRQEMLGGIIVLSILGSLVIGINIVIIRFFWWLGGVLFGG